ncbi:hypothetical protein XU18_0056 [Perkinsela sp. CCAP 1560/4]|nr:hypothetical protein XU18_0056 [Perkinsela sp. CCAP 1560/4]|eukprot:KNH09371.1 hypothetical protein XU18_0056 [Perkinsela sp. CCAP 1560/4]
MWTTFQGKKHCGPRKLQVFTMCMIALELTRVYFASIFFRSIMSDVHTSQGDLIKVLHAENIWLKKRDGRSAIRSSIVLPTSSPKELPKRAKESKSTLKQSNSATAGFRNEISGNSCTEKKKTQEIAPYSIWS